MVAEETEDILREVFQPRKDLAVNERQRVLLVNGVHIDLMTPDHHPVGIVHSRLEIGCCLGYRVIICGGLGIHM